MRFPSWVGFVDRLDLGQSLSIGWEVLQNLTVDLVSLANLDLVKDVENVELGKINAGIVIHRVRIFDENQVEPSTTALALSGNANFVADGGNLLSNFLEKTLVHSEPGWGEDMTHIEEFGWEWPASNTGSVGLDNTNNLLDG
jgi:hypothetical protein